MTSSEMTPPDGGFERRSFSWTAAWLQALTQPNVDSYQELAEDPSASVGKAFAWVFVGGLVSTAVAAVLRMALVSSTLSNLDQSSQTGLGLGVVALITLICVVPFSAAVTGLVLMINAAIQQFVAGALGGEGSFTRLYYVMAAYSAPISVVASLLALIPLLGICLSAILGFYTLALNALAIKSVNRFGWGSAILAMFIPLIIVILIMVIIFMLLYPAMSQLITQPSA